MKKLSFAFDNDRDHYTFNWSTEQSKEILEKIVHNPFFATWENMAIAATPMKKVPFDFGKILKAVFSEKKDLCVWGFGGGNEFLINRNNNFYHVFLTLDKNYLEKDNVIKFKEYMINIALNTPRFSGMNSSMGSEYYDIQKKHNVTQEKSMFSYIPWLSILPPIKYNGYYEKEDLLKAPYYRVEEIKPDIVLIQAYKDPFDIETEESLNYLRNGVEYLNKNIVFLKGK